MDISYIDIATKVNARTIGVYASNFAHATGEKWFTSTSPYPLQTLREVYNFTAAGNIPHGVNFSTINTFTRIYGVVYDGSKYYPLPYVDTTAVNNQISLAVDGTNIIITAGGGAPPTIVSGIVVLEWMSKV